MAGWQGESYPRESCGLVWIPNENVLGGHKGFGLIVIYRLEHREGTALIDVSLVPLIAKEPKACQEGAG